MPTTLIEDMKAAGVETAWCSECLRELGRRPDGLWVHAQPWMIDRKNRHEARPLISGAHP